MKVSEIKTNLRFPGASPDTKSNGQALQDFFVLIALGGKRKGYFLEIGASDGKSLSNTFLLEKEFDWNGVSIDYDVRSWLSFKKNRRRSKFILGDATALDYKKILKRVNAQDGVLDYLQVDIEPSTNTLLALKQIPFSDFKFRVITYETDWYDKSQGHDVADRTRLEARELLVSYGYELVAGDVFVNEPDKPFEDWWILPSQIDDKTVGQIRANFRHSASPFSFLASENTSQSAFRSTRSFDD